MQYVYRHSDKYLSNRHIMCKGRERMHKDNSLMKNIVNTSCHTLISSEIKLLNRGLSFVPKPSKIHLERIISEFDQLVRKMRFRYKFRASTRKMSRYRRKSNAQALRSSNNTLEYALDTMRSQILSLNYEQNPGTNLTFQEQQALKRLKEDNALVINKADKGSTIVVQNHSDYALAGFNHLNDDKVYKKLHVDCTQEVCRKLHTFLNKLFKEGLINKDMLDFCTPPSEVRTARMYFLLKVHKNPMGIRPIVSSVNYATENLSQFVDIWLQPLMKGLPSFIQDTNHFIKMIEETHLNQDCLLASIDVTSLYTNIRHEDGIEATVEALHATYAKDEDQPPPEVIGDMLRFILTHNVFEFEEKYFLQLQGCTMGSKCSPSYACIYMGLVEKTLQFLGGEKIALWKRYIDDIFVIYNGSKDEFACFMSQINTLYDTIKFTYECDFQQLNFLDTTVYKGSRFHSTGFLDIKTHVKPTNKQLYVHSTSYHPSGCKKGIITGEALRYLRTNSDVSTFNDWISHHKQNLRSRGYKPSVTNTLLQPITHDKRQIALTPKSKAATQTLTFVNTFNDRTPNIRSIIHNNWKLLHIDPVLKELFPTPPIMALKKNRAITNLLVKSKPEAWEKPSSGTQCTPIDLGPICYTPHQDCSITKCNRRACALCPRLSTDSSVTSRVSKRKHRIYGDFNCRTSRLVYLLECTKCGKQYVGQTILTFAHRVAKHLLHIRQLGRDKLQLHFNGDGHTVNDIIFHPIATIDIHIPIKEAENLLQSLETVWIKRLASLQPLGLNYILEDKQSRVM